MACALTLLTACKEQPKATTPARPEVVIRTVQPGPVPLRTELPGRTAPFMVAEVRPQVGGIIRQRPFTEGATVRAGQVLYEIDAASYQATVQQQEGALASAQAQLKSAAAQAERYRALLPQRGVSQQENDNAQAAYAQAQAQVRVQTALLNTARINLQYTRVTAPISGHTSRSSVTPGALVSASQAAPLLTISQLDPIYVDIAQSSAELVRLRQALQAGRFSREGQAQRVSLVLEDGTPYPHEGRIQLTEVTVDPSSGSVTLRARFPNPDGLLLPGMYVRTVVVEGVTPNGILMPPSAIARDRKGNPMARVLTAEDKIELRPVAIARTVGTDWLVTEGLKAGERIIVEGAASAAAGTQVKVSTDEAATAGHNNNAPSSERRAP